jgi:abortive infection alpha-like protein
MAVDATLVIVGLQAGAAAGAAKPAAELVKSFIERLFGPSVDYAGQGLRKWLERRTFRAQAVIADAAQMLQDADVEAREVPGRILLPLIEYASLEDDEELQRKWAALLANAASSKSSNFILPAFADILRQLTPVQARMLDWMHDMKSEYETWPTIWPDVSRDQIETAFSLSPANYALLITDLERLQLIEPRRDIKSNDETIDGDEMFQLIIARWNSQVKYDSIGFTALGLRFVEACKPPSK